MSTQLKDISEKVFDELEFRRLLEQSELLDATELLAGIGHYQWDYVNDRLISCSQGYARIHNSTIEAILEEHRNWENCLAQIHPDDREFYVAAYESQRESGHFTIEYRLLRGDEIRWIREVGILRSDEQGQTIDVFGLLQDITAMRSYEADLEDQQELARQVEALTDIGHFIIDEEDERYLYLSSGYARIMGHSVESYMKLINSEGDFLQSLHPADRERIRSGLEHYRNSGEETFEAEYRIVQPEGKVVWIRERSKSRYKKDGKVKLSLGVLQDITAEKEYEKSLQQAKDLLEITVKNRTRELADTITRLETEISEREKISSELEGKNAELERFAYTVSHDLKTPLVTIKGFLGLLDKDIASNDLQGAGDDITKINQAADIMVTLLEDLLELSRIGRVVGEVETLPLDKVVQKALSTVETRIRELGIDLQIGELPCVVGDETRLVEVYQNLIENSIKFIGNQASPKIEIGAEKYNGRTSLFVRDNGIGIDSKYHELVFGLFERLDLDVEGTGVGLALVKRIIEVHGGRIWIESSEGAGCTFWFRLPTGD